MRAAIAEHALAALFPQMPAGEYAALKLDIDRHGLREPVWLYQGELLDGRHRWRACAELGIACPTREYTGSDPLAFVLSANLTRRHLSTSQRAMVAARIANMQHGGDRRSDQAANLPLVSQDQAAEQLSVSERSVRDAKHILDQAEPEVVQAVEAGLLPVSQAAKLAEVQPTFQRRVVEKLQSGEATTATEAMRQVKHEDRPALALDIPGKYRVLYADPPWSYGNSGLKQYGHASHHYPTMSVAELCAMPVKDLAEGNAVLFLWVTSPMLFEAVPLVAAWGFSYKTSFIWDKMRHNFGHYNSVRHELLLVCTRGSCTPDVNVLHDSVLSIERSATHSEKPDAFRAIIDETYPNGKRLELFARGTVPDGWDTWGNE